MMVVPAERTIPKPSLRSLIGIGRGCAAAIVVLGLRIGLATVRSPLGVACGGGHVVEVIDWSRPELFEALRLPMSFPPSDRSNEDEVNAREVR
jgi:hypothetical protein